MSYHTASNTPKNVRPEVIRGWNQMWNRLRRMLPVDRRLEFTAGTRMIVGGVQFVLTKYSTWEWTLSLGKYELPITVSCASSYKPYTYLDELQTVVDELVVRSVTEA